MATSKDHWLKRVNLTVSNVIFYVLFWGVHIAIFAVGWFVVTPSERCRFVLTGQ